VYHYSFMDGWMDGWMELIGFGSIEPITTG